VVKRRDRDTIAGDLLEEYRETVRPTRGRWFAEFWYSRQVISLIDGVWFGFLLGLAFGAWNLIMTRLDPLADDTPGALLAFYGPMFTIWAVAGYRASRRTGRVLNAIKTSMIVAMVTFTVFSFANLLRVNLFLDAITQRLDWQYMMQKFRASDFESLRLFITYQFVTDVPVKILVASVIGGIMGLIGGLIGRLSRSVFKVANQ
jgi:hypothetical protein